MAGPCKPCQAAKLLRGLKGCVHCRKRMADMEASDSKLVRGVARVIRPLHEAIVGTDPPKRRQIGSK